MIFQRKAALPKMSEARKEAPSILPSPPVSEKSREQTCANLSKPSTTPPRSASTSGSPAPRVASKGNSSSHVLPRLRAVKF